jgi:heat shock protein HtpX
VHRIHSALILLGLVGIFGLVGYTAFGSGTAILIVSVGLFVNFGSRRSTARMILRVHKARPLGYRESPAIHQIMQDLSVRSDVRTPDIAVYPSDIPNAFALSLSRDKGVLAVSTAMLRLLNLDEIRGVPAHEIAHLKNWDSLIGVSAGLFVQAISTVASLFGFLLFALALSGATPSGLITTALIVIAAPYAARYLQASLMRTRERMADRDAAALTGEPRALASALAKLERYNRYLKGFYRRFRFIYTTEYDAGPRWLRTHPPTEERIQDLLELEGRIVPLPPVRRYRYVV